MDLKTTLTVEVQIRRLQVSRAHKRMAKEQQEAHRLKQTLPKSRLTELRRDIADANANVTSAVAALEGVSKYPPLRAV